PALTGLEGCLTDFPRDRLTLLDELKGTENPRVGGSIPPLGTFNIGTSRSKLSVLFAVLYVGRSGTQFKNDFAVIGRQAALPRPGTRVPSPSSLPPSGNCQASRTRVPPCRAGRERGLPQVPHPGSAHRLRAPGGLQEPGRRAR